MASLGRAQAWCRSLGSSAKATSKSSVAMACMGNFIKQKEHVIKAMPLPSDDFKANKDEASSSASSNATTQSEMCDASEMTWIDTDSGTEIHGD